MLALTAPTVWICSGCRAPESVRPNLVLITVDALRADQLDCYGGGEGIGAEVCGIAERGALYVWAFSTAAAGAPATASILTSQHPSRHGVAESGASFLGQDHATLASLLRAGGYTTAAFVASPELNRSRNFQLGFDRFDDREASRDPRSAEHPPLTKVATAWLARARPPWFLWIHLSEPHGPFAFPEAPGAIAPTSELRLAYAKRYQAALRQLDRELSQLITVLDARDESLGILLTANHGQSLGERGRFGHGGEPELELVRVPLLWRPPRAGPGQSVGRRVTTAVSILDVAPTLLEAAGLAVPSGLGGVVLPYVDSSPEAAPSAPRSLFAEGPTRVAVIEDALFYSRDRTRVPEAFPTSEEPAPAGAPAKPGLDPRVRPQAARLDGSSQQDGQLPEVAKPRPPMADWEALDRRIEAFLGRGAIGATEENFFPR